MPVVDHFQVLSQQLAAHLEATAGTAETLVAADVALRPYQDISFAPSFPRFANNEVADDIGQAPDFVAAKMGSINFPCTFHSAGAVGTEPAIGKYLEACGLKMQVVRTITISAPSGGSTQFAEGDVFSATGGKAGIVNKLITTGGTLEYILTAGSALANSDVVTVGSVTASCSGASALFAMKYTPRSTNHKTLTMQRAIKNFTGTSAQDFLSRLRGVAGTFSLDAAALDVMRFKGDFTGVVDYLGAGSFFTPVTYEAPTVAQLPKFINAKLQINGKDVVTDSLSFIAGNSVEMDPDPTMTGGTAGYLQARIRTRAPTITIAPYRLIPSVLDDLGILGDGSTFPFELNLGTSPQRIDIVAPKCQLRAETLGNRAGLETGQMTLHITRDVLTDNDYAIYFK
jgi:hypothetical protein